MRRLRRGAIPAEAPHPARTAHSLAALARDLQELDLRHLAAIAELAHTSSLRQVALRLEVDPGTVGRWVERLERALRRRLVERGPRGAVLTEAGRLLAAHAEVVGAAMRAARDDLDALAAGETGAVRIGTVAGRSGRLAAQIAAALTRRRPRLDAVSFDFPDEERGCAALAADGVDLLLSEQPLPGAFESCRLLLDAPVLLVPAGSRLAERAQPPQAADLSALPLVEPRSHGARARLTEALRRCGARPRIAQRADEIATVHALVGAGLAAAIVPRLAVDPHDRATVAIDLGHLLAPIAIGLTWRGGDRRPAIVAVREAARVVSAEVAAQRALLASVAR